MKMKKMNKKGVELPLRTIVIAALLLVFLVIMIIFVSNIFGKEKTEITKKIDCLNNDRDNDGVVDIADKCCNTWSADKGDVDLTGCYPGQEKEACKPPC